MQRETICLILYLVVLNPAPIKTENEIPSSSENEDIRFNIPRIASRPGTAWFQRSGSNILLWCLTKDMAATEKYVGASYMWTDAQGQGVINQRAVLYGNGSLLITDLRSDDTDTYLCLISLRDKMDDVTTHTLIVYTDAKFLMTNPFVYSVASCNDQLNAGKMSELLGFLCSDYSIEECPFRGRLECTRRSQAEIDESLENLDLFQVKIVIEQYPEKDFLVPQCSVVCMKKAIVVHLQQFGDKKIRDLLAREDRSSGSSDLQFEKEELGNRRIRTQCLAGFELYQKLFCVPCSPGTYLRYEYSYRGNGNLQCEPCPIGYYQPGFGKDECIQCPRLTMTHDTAADTVALCRSAVFDMKLVYDTMYMALAAIAVLGLCCVIYFMRKKTKLFKTRNSDSATDVTENTADNLLKHFHNMTASNVVTHNNNNNNSALLITPQSHSNITHSGTETAQSEMSDRSLGSVLPASRTKHRTGRDAVSRTNSVASVSGGPYSVASVSGGPYRQVSQLSVGGVSRQSSHMSVTSHELSRDPSRQSLCEHRNTRHHVTQDVNKRQRRPRDTETDLVRLEPPPRGRVPRHHLPVPAARNGH